MSVRLFLLSSSTSKAMLRSPHGRAQIQTRLTVKYGEKWQQRIYQANVHDIDELKKRSIDVWHGFKQSVINDVIYKGLRLRVMSDRTFWALNLTSDAYAWYANFVINSWSKIIQRYGVKCIRSFAIFWPPVCYKTVQGDIQGVVRNMARFPGVVANFIASMTAKEFRKSSDACQGYE